MGRKIRMYLLDDGFKGGPNNIADYLLIDVAEVNKMLKNELSIRGHEYEFLGYYSKVKIYRMLYDGEIIFEGTAKEIEEKFGYLQSRVSYGCKNHMLGKYTIRYIGEKYEKC